ncbi:acetyl/propionyl/methylcrotonyl-CoA carboxylase subunit alpha [Litoribacillus peritrichatus]|uniref:Geranyl-CoA carboxylase subunit apha n=1 Tax=Litoribacillus peritrichatus TaxID=718191 RepID=A0ABP7M8A0_9GAMM
MSSNMSSNMSSHMKTPVKKLLIANRGEIACRVIRTARMMGINTVAVYSDADADAPHVEMADQAVHIGAAPVAESYLSIEKIINAAKATNSDAIHPGYGFLSENAAFTQACDQAGIQFVGPSAEAIELMGSKRQSKIAMLDSGVPCIPGYQGEDQSDQALKSAALDIGLPVMLKASAGGGGRGMRLVSHADQLETAIKSARSEAINAFGSGELIIEKAVIAPRHIEIQIFADQFGNTVYLGERDCSVQRRHQKVVEEAPSPAVSPALRERMGQAAVNAAKACQYCGAGTVEFLLDADQNFYFLEMNTRLQVEHPVTELITGQDLVEWQLRVASGEALPLKQEDIQIKGHAIEVRLYAEDPANDFCPQTGEISLWQPAELVDFRVDGGIQSGQIISPFYDPMLAKLIAYGNDREQARQKLLEGIEHTHLVGVTDNRYFLSEILKTPSFIQGEATTAFIEHDFKDNASIQIAPPGEDTLAIAAYLLAGQTSWSTAALGPKPCWLKSGEHEQRVLISQNFSEASTEHGQTNHSVMIGGEEFAIEILSERLEGKLEFAHITLNQQDHSVYFLIEHQGILNPRKRLYLAHHGRHHWFEDITLRPASQSDQNQADNLKASMDGLIIDVMAQPGDTVTQGQPLVILEAMKMEHSLTSPRDGIIQSISVEQGQQVNARQVLIELKEQESK